MQPNSNTDLARKTVRGTMWLYASYYLGKLLVFVSTVVLARLLSKEDFGIVGYAATAIGFLDVLADLGVGPALIYHRNEPRAPDTAFWLGLVFRFTLFIITWLSGPFFGYAFNDPRAVDVTRVLALSFPIAGLGDVHDTLLRKTLSFNKKFIPDLTAALSKGALSILLALFGFGPWSLIVGQLGGTALGVVAAWLVCPWRPSFQFDLVIAKSLSSYGIKTVALNLLSDVALNIDYFFVGRFLGPATLGVYTLAFRIPELLIMQFCGIISRVVFPVFSSMRNEGQSLNRGFLEVTRYVSLVTVPLGLGLALIAEPFVLVLFTDKWLEAVPVLRAISLYSLLVSLAYNAGNVYKAQGWVGIMNILSLIETLILIPALWLAVTVGGNIAIVSWTHVVVAAFSAALDLGVASRKLQSPIKDIFLAFSPAAISGGIMSAAVWAALQTTAPSSPLIQLITSVTVGGAVYAASLWWLQRELVLQASHVVRTALARR